MVKYLSDEFFEALQGALDQSPAVKEAAAGLAEEVRFQYEIERPGQETVPYWIAGAPGAVQIQAGRLDEPTFTFRMDLETAEALALGNLNPQTALFKRKLWIEGPMLRLLKLNPFLTAVLKAGVEADIDIETE